MNYLTQLNKSENKSVVLYLWLDGIKFLIRGYDNSEKANTSIHFRDYISLKVF